MALLAFVSVTIDLYLKNHYDFEIDFTSYIILQNLSCCNRTFKNPELYVKHNQKKHDKFGLT